MRNFISNVKSEADVLRFATLNFKGHSYDVLQAYYSNLFDLWENPPCDLSKEVDDRLARQRWNVYDYCSKKRWNLDRDSMWSVDYDDKSLTGNLSR